MVTKALLPFVFQNYLLVVVEKWVVSKHDYTSALKKVFSEQSTGFCSFKKSKTDNKNEKSMKTDLGRSTMSTDSTQGSLRVLYG